MFTFKHFFLLDFHCLIYSALYQKAKTKVIREQWGCNLCKSLQDPKPSKTYEDLGAWWIGGGNC